MGELMWHRNCNSIISRISHRNMYGKWNSVLYFKCEVCCLNMTNTFFWLWGHIFLHFALTMFMYKRINTQNYFRLKVWVVALQKYHNLCCLLVRCISFNAPLDNIVNVDVTLLMKPQNAGLCSPLWPLSREGSFLWNNCCDTGLGFCGLA